jgi:hypothetical protein
MEALGKIVVRTLWGTVVWAGIDKSKRKHKPIFVCTDQKIFFLHSAPCPQYVTEAEAKKIIKRYEFYKTGCVFHVGWEKVGA